MKWFLGHSGAGLKKKVDDLDQRARQNPLFISYNQTTFGTEFAIEKARRHHRATSRYPRGPEFDLSYGFIHAAKGLFHELDRSTQQRFLGRLRDGINGNFGLRPLVYEIQIFTHLCRCGFDVECTDLYGRGNFDFLASRFGAELEIECKTIAPDAGLKIHRNDLINLGGKLNVVSQRLFERTGGHLISIGIPDRLTSNEKLTDNIVSLVDNAITTGRNEEEGVAIIDYRQIAVNRRIETHDIDHYTRDLFLTEFGRGNANIMSRGSPFEDSFVGIMVHSLKADNVQDTLIERVKEAADQCSGSRPAIVMMQLLEMSEKTLREAVLCQSGLHQIAETVFKNDKRRHINSISFTLPPKIHRTVLIDVAEAIGMVGSIQNPMPKFPTHLTNNLFSAYS